MSVLKPTRSPLRTSMPCAAGRQVGVSLGSGCDTGMPVQRDMHGPQLLSKVPRALLTPLRALLPPRRCTAATCCAGLRCCHLLPPATHPRLSKVDTPHQLAHNQDVHTLHHLRATHRRTRGTLRVRWERGAGRGGTGCLQEAHGRRRRSAGTCAAVLPAAPLPRASVRRRPPAAAAPPPAAGWQRR